MDNLEQFEEVLQLISFKFNSNIAKIDELKIRNEELKSFKLIVEEAMRKTKKTRSNNES